MNRREALRTTAALGVAGAGLVGGSSGPRLGAARAAALPGGWRSLRLEFDVGSTEPGVSILRAGMGMAQRGDQFMADGQIYAAEAPSGPPIGYWQCNAVWIATQGDTSVPHTLFCLFWYELDGRGAITGPSNRAGMNPLAHVGAVTGGAGEFLGALGSWTQAPSIQGRTRQIFDLLLPS